MIVYEEGEGSVVAAMDPVAALGIAGNDALRPVAEEARTRLERVLGRLSSAAAS